MPTILGPDGQPIDLAQLREPQLAAVRHMATELDMHPARGLTPARLAALLQEGEAGDLVSTLELADDIEERDGHVYAELAKRKLAVASLEWTVQPPKGASADEQKLADAVIDWLQSWPEFPDVLLGMMDAVLKGFGMHELVWVPDGKLLRPTATFAPSRWFTTGPDRRSLMLRSLQPTTPDPATGLSPKGAQPLLPYAWLQHVHPARSGYLTRNGLVRVLAWPYLFKHYSVRDLAEFLEIFGIPTRLGRYPAGASDREKNTLLQAVVGIGHNAAGIIPQGMAIDFMEAAQGTEGPFTAMWDRMDAVESKVILGQTLTAGEGRHGTQALGQVHNEVRHDIRDADARQVEQTINGQLIAAWCAINWPGADMRRLPRWKLDTGDAEDLKAYAENLPKLAGAGLRIGVAWVHERLRIPQAEADEPVITAPAPPPMPAAPGPAGAAGRMGADDPADDEGDDAAGARGRAALAAQPGAAPRDAIDDIVDQAVAEWRPQLGPLVAPLLAEIDKAVAAGESLAAFASRLPQIVQATDHAPLAEQLARAAFVARLAGDADAEI